jgi:2-oxoglutarate ferredoxin oxidoreductase subunit beta
MLSSFTYNDEFPTPIGVIYSVDEPIYEHLLDDQIKFAIEKQGKGDIDTILAGPNIWEVK